MKIITPIITVACILLVGCEAKVHIKSEPSKSSQFDEHGGYCCISLKTNEVAAWSAWQEWKRTNVVQVVEMKIDYVLVSQAEYDQLTNWMRWMSESK